MSVLAVEAPLFGRAGRSLDAPRSPDKPMLRRGIPIPMERMTIIPCCWLVSGGTTDVSVVVGRESW